MAKYPFLSGPWVAEARRIYAEAARALPVPPATPPVRVNLVVTEVPFSEGPLDAHLDTTTGALSVDIGHLPEPDVTVSMDYTTARTLFVGGDVQGVMQAFLAGRIKVDGDLSKLLDPRSGIWPASTPAPDAAAAPAGGGPGTPRAGGPAPADSQQPLGFPVPATFRLAARLQEITEITEIAE
jgi:hypothetical protein